MRLIFILHKTIISSREKYHNVALMKLPGKQACLLPYYLGSSYEPGSPREKQSGYCQKIPNETSVQRDGIFLRRRKDPSLCKGYQGVLYPPDYLPRGGWRTFGPEARTSPGGQSSRGCLAGGPLGYRGVLFDALEVYRIFNLFGPAWEKRLWLPSKQQGCAKLLLI